MVEDFQNESVLAEYNAGIVSPFPSHQSFQTFRSDVYHLSGWTVKEEDRPVVVKLSKEEPGVALGRLSDNRTILLPNLGSD